MTQADRLKEIQHNARRAEKLREQHGLISGSDSAERVRDELTGVAAIPFTVISIALIVYALMALIGWA